MHRAAGFGKAPAVVRALIQAGADARLRDKSGRTPIDYARRNEALKGSISLFKRRK